MDDPGKYSIKLLELFNKSLLKAESRPLNADSYLNIHRQQLPRL